MASRVGGTAHCVAAALVVAAAACGRAGFDALPSNVPDDGAPPDAVSPADIDAARPIDAAVVVDAAVAIDASPDAAAPPRCTSGAFGPPALVTDLGLGPDLFGPSPTTDGATLFFSHLSGGVVSEDIYVASRPMPGAPFDPGALVPGVNTGLQDGTPFVSADGLTLVFTSERAGGAGDRDLWLATRASVDADFVLDRNIAELNTSAIENTPSMTGDGLTIMFGSSRNGPGDREDIFTATRASPTAAFEPPTRVDELSTSSYESSVFITGDGLAVYFMSDRPGGQGCDDIWFAQRGSTDVPFGAPTPIVEANTSDCEDDPAISADGCELWFSSNRSGDGFRLYRATRTP